ncbi:hypothetical protein [Trinickia acidisoli]|uniref:hypothetical protein n=1 Tax=Trinickia acidisoli TaxID=2767482 RepID=UPI001F5C92B2|nr:hypothetical protein [Trinickia acidisoli]
MNADLSSEPAMLLLRIHQRVGELGRHVGIGLSQVKIDQPCVEGVDGLSSACNAGQQDFCARGILDRREESDAVDLRHFVIHYNGGDALESRLVVERILTDGVTGASFHLQVCVARQSNPVCTTIVRRHEIERRPRFREKPIQLPVANDSPQTVKKVRTIVDKHDGQRMKQRLPDKGTHINLGKENF